MEMTLAWSSAILSLAFTALDSGSPWTTTDRSRFSFSIATSIDDVDLNLRSLNTLAQVPSRRASGEVLSPPERDPRAYLLSFFGSPSAPRAFRQGLAGFTDAHSAEAKKARLQARAEARAAGKKEEVTKRPNMVRFGIQNVTRAIETREVTIFVGPAGPHRPRCRSLEVVIFLPALCRKFRIPYAVVKGKAALGTVVRRKVTVPEWSDLSSSSASPRTLEIITVAVLRRIRISIGLEKANRRYGHSVRMANRQPRYTFCRLHLDLGTMFLTHCFTDESMVQSCETGRFVYILKGDNSRRVQPRHKHPASLMIWGGISWEGATPLAIIRRGTKVDGPVYQSILHNVYLEWAQKTYGGKVLLVQDNARRLILRMQKQMEKVVQSKGAPVYD
ncbi:hypothetical protein PRIPAC_75355 [Pristionchus pacificus]|uniref:Ribosomal protein n=1 Tax=Pristionchus pacificus TaxID=54126 RepID=A0A2A6BF63_PRIPA|nr:hypothetical protein PRIPAC_75355 [Pristionchus pacificus]|eukprot:PDM64527.1 ribosomal protein [Pristionchus pacificus]